MSFHRFLLMSALAASGAISSASAQGTSVPGGTTPGGPITLPGGVVTTPLMINRTYVFPPVTLATTEAARVTVVNTAVASTIVPPPVTPANSPTTSTAPTCSGTISFLTSNTVMLTPPSTTFTLAAGQFAFLDLPYSKSGLGTPPAGEPAGEVVGEVQLGVPIPQVAGCSLQMSLVTYDASTGAGHLVLGNAAANQIGPVPILAIGAR